MEVFPIDKKVEQLFKEVSRRIFRLQNGRSLDSMERIGADTRGQIGASYLSLKNLAGQYQPDLRLAQLLWGTKKREEQIVACFLFPVQELITEKITQLLQYCYNFEIAEYFGTLVLSKRENVKQMVNEYLNSDHSYLYHRHHIRNRVSIVVNSSLIQGTIQNNTIIRPARLSRNACSSLPLCLRIWLSTATTIPSAAILKIIVTLIHSRFPSYAFTPEE